MSKIWHDAPEVAPQSSLPEVYYPARVLATPYRRDDNFASIPLKRFTAVDDTVTVVGTPKDSFPGTNTINTFDNESRAEVPPTIQEREPPRRICGCSLLVFILSAAIAILFATVIGLAAGVGVLNNRAMSAELKLSSELSRTMDDIDRGCSAHPESVTKTRYTTDFFDRSTYTIFCNNDAPNPPLQSLFVGNFDDCMDACASYSTYTAGNFPFAKIGNFTCSGVSFIPDWTNRTIARSINAPGNCYLKPGPQNATALSPNSGGTAVHAAILS
ncbi:hypothetical protein F4777DRAFT_108830 [Nemania sp. FL0916]|nr:hypothetical protein F4777DRAFT_108830 [Nemania sp. FL0916]